MQREVAVDMWAVMDGEGLARGPWSVARVVRDQAVRWCSSCGCGCSVGWAMSRGLDDGWLELSG